MISVFVCRCHAVHGSFCVCVSTRARGGLVLSNRWTPMISGRGLCCTTYHFYLLFPPFSFSLFFVLFFVFCFVLLSFLVLDLDVLAPVVAAVVVVVVVVVVVDDVVVCVFFFFFFSG